MGNNSTLSNGGGGSQIFLALDPAFESSNDSHKIELSTRRRRRRKRTGSLVCPSGGNISTVIGRTDTLSILGSGLSADGSDNVARLVSNGNFSS